jgi:hypothetical protein
MGIMRAYFNKASMTRYSGMAFLDIEFCTLAEDAGKNVCKNNSFPNVCVTRKRYAVFKAAFCIGAHKM